MGQHTTQPRRRFKRGRRPWPGVRETPVPSASSRIPGPTGFLGEAKGLLLVAADAPGARAGEDRATSMKAVWGGATFRITAPLGR